MVRELILFNENKLDLDLGRSSHRQIQLDPCYAILHKRIGIQAIKASDAYRELYKLIKIHCTN